VTILDRFLADIHHAAREYGGMTLLFIDPLRQWERLMLGAAGRVELLTYDGSQLALRVAIERHGPATTRVVYVPLAREQLTVLKEYEFTLPVWDRRLVPTLRAWGVDVATEDEKALASYLPGLVARWADRPIEFWRNLTAHSVGARLFDDEKVRAFLDRPDDIAADIEHEGLLPLFRDFLAESFGVRTSQTGAPKELAHALVCNLLLAEAVEAAGDTGFPYRDQLPLPLQREQCVQFLHRWLEAWSQSATAARIIREGESTFQFGPWIASRHDFPNVQASLQIERALVQRVLADLRDQESLDERALLLTRLLPVFQRHATHFWARQNGVPEWTALLDAATAVEAARDALQELPNCLTAASTVTAYTERWWRADRAYRRYRAIGRSSPELAPVAETVRRLHRRYLEETNKRFAEALDGHVSLEATGLPPGRSFWPVEGARRRAVLVLDAFRFELARDLEEQLRAPGGETKVELRAMRAPIPSVTPLGMAALLPVDDPIVDVRLGGEWSIREQGAGSDAPDLAEKSGRERLLASRLEGYQSLDLTGLIGLPISAIPAVPWLFVYSQTLDEAGHAGVLRMTIEHAATFVTQCADAARKLAAAGVEELHVVADHGFFVLDDFSEADLITVAIQDVLYKSPRAIVAPRLDTTTLLTFPLRGSDLVVGVPRSIGILQARGGYEYFHGGAALQEVVIPHLRVQFPRRSVKVDIGLRAPARVTSMLFDVEIEAVAPSGQRDLFAAVAPRYVEVRAYALRDGVPVQPPIATASGAEQFVSETVSHRSIRLRISAQARFRYGDTLRIIAYDADTPDMELAQTTVALHVEPDV